MPPQTACITVALVAALRGALERFLIPVREQMTIEMVLPLEGLVAHGAQVFPLVAVRQAMFGEGRGVAKHLVAEAAFLRTGLAGIESV